MGTDIRWIDDVSAERDKADKHTYVANLVSGRVNGKRQSSAIA